MALTFAEQLGHYVARSLYSQGQLAALSGVPKNTIHNWLSGQVRRPQRWEPVVRVAAALHLTAAETDTLLRAAGHSSLALLMQQPHPLLRPWQAHPNGALSLPGEWETDAAGWLEWLEANAALYLRPVIWLRLTRIYLDQGEVAKAKGAFEQFSVAAKQLHEGIEAEMARLRCLLAEQSDLSSR